MLSKAGSGGWPAARTDDERYLLARVLDKYEQFERRGIPVYTGFLSPQEQALSEGLLHAAGVREGFAFWGGYEGAERRRLCFLPDWLEAPEMSAVRVLRCRFYHENALTHRDLLGGHGHELVTAEVIQLFPAGNQFGQLF